MAKMVSHKGDRNNSSRGIAVPGLYGVRYFGKPVPMRKNPEHNGKVIVTRPKDPDWKDRLSESDRKRLK